MSNPRSANRSSTSRKLKVKRAWSQTAWRMTSGGNRWRVKEMVCIPTCYTEKSIEVRALNVTMPVLDPNIKEKAPKPDDGQLWKRGFIVAVYSEKYLEGAREFATPATGACRAISSLHDEYLKQSANNPGMVPVVKFDGATPTQIGKGHTNVPILTIEKWAPRPNALKNGADNPSAPEQAVTSGPWDEPPSTEPDDEF